jgi:hypothetical protein
MSLEEMEKPAQTCASLGRQLEDPKHIQLAKLQAEARRCAKAVASTGRMRNRAAWDALLPVLDSIQKLLSQRGANHKRAGRGLPEWSVWWNQFSDNNDLSISFRTVQYRLTAYRGTFSRGRRYRLSTTRKEQLELAKTAMAGHRLAGAYSMGVGTIEDIKLFYAESLPLGTVRETLERLSANSKPQPPQKPIRLAYRDSLETGPPESRTF